MIDRRPTVSFYLGSLAHAAVWRHARAVRVRVGTSGWSYPAWKGRFYPSALPAARMLAFYSGHFSAVEVNHTFREIPEARTLSSWSEQVGVDFVFALKAPQTLTHFHRLRACALPLRLFLNRARLLGTRLGPLLFQLPPNFAKDVSRLRTFLRLLPPEVKAAFEFRHPSWLVEEVYALLRAHDVALCIAEDEERVTPWVSTASFGYLRLRRPRYPASRLDAWTERIRHETWGETFVFFKHEDEARGPRFAAQLVRSLG